MLERLEEIDRLLDEAEAGGGPASLERLRGRGKLPVRERIALALDPDSPFLEISALAGYNSDYKIGGGAVLGIGVIAGVECVIFANDPTVLGGALTPYVGKKWMRALEIARDNGLPYVSFVESAGADLRMDPDEAGEGKKKKRRPAKTFHFAETGRFFYEMIELSKLRIPSVCVVFGSSTAGGAYQPGMSDYNVVIKRAVEDLPGRSAAREDGDRRGLRRRDTRWRPDARRGLGARRVSGRGRARRAAVVPRGRVASQLAQARDRRRVCEPTRRSSTPRNSSDS